MSETPCQPSQPKSGHQRTDLADIATDRGTSNPEQDTTESKREEVSPFSHPARNAEAQDATSEAETAPDACQSADNCQPAVTTLPGVTRAENAFCGAMKTRLAPDGQFIPLGTEWSEQEQKVVPVQLVRKDPAPGANLDTVMRRCGQTDDEAPATGTEALVCADIARRQRRGLAKYGVTVIGNPLSFVEWLQHFYEELLDGAVYAKRILTMNHDNQNENQSDGSAPGVLPDNANPPNRHRKPGAGRKAKPCPGCGATKSIGSTVKAGIPTRRCKQCGFVVQTYPHLANVKAAE